MARVAAFPVTLSKLWSQPVSVSYQTHDGTAVAPSDYTATSGSLTFAVGETSKTVYVPVRDTIVGTPNELFTLQLSSPTNGVIGAGSGTATIPGDTVVPDQTYLDRFEWAYSKIKTPANGYFGPPSGAKALTIPYHSVEKLIVEAPDWGHQTTSEAASFWLKLEAWKLGLAGTTTGYAAAWTSIETNFIPSATNQPVSGYDPSAPATYQPDADTPSGYPTSPDQSVPVGVDPLATPLQTTYGNPRISLMHWLFDVDGDYGFVNGDGTNVMVAINTFQRGIQESTWEAITQPEWENWAQGGNAYGFLPIFNKGKPTYPTAPFDYSKQFRYTCAPDAEVRAIAASYLANRFAADQALSVTTQDTKAKKMGDYLRYSLYDKYFKAIPGYDGTGKHNVVSWYVAWGGDIPASGPGAWGFRIGSSEAHHGYNGVDVAYAMCSPGGAYSPTTAGAAAQWEASLSRQLEMIRWLQSPEGPIAGGVTNSWNGRYETPADGRQTAKFYGMYYTYSPVWHDPPSNDWVGFQAWGLERVASLYLTVSNKSGSFNADIRSKCSVILDKFVPWILANAVLVDATTFTLPATIGWSSGTQIPGQTATVPNLEGSYEYLPTLNWDSAGNYATFWDVSLTPNPNLHCWIKEHALDIGVGAAMAQLLLQYAEAKRRSGGSLATVIPGTAYTVQNVFDLARGIMDRLWLTYRDDLGFCKSEVRTDYIRYKDPIYLPPGYSGTMPNGDPLVAGSTTFISMRTFMKTHPDWPLVQAYLDGGPAPTFSYHRFWHQIEIAVGFGMIHKYFADVVYP